MRLPFTTKLHLLVLPRGPVRYRKVTLPPLESDGSVARWYRRWWFTR